MPTKDEDVSTSLSNISFISYNTVTTELSNSKGEEINIEETLPSDNFQEISKWKWIRWTQSNKITQNIIWWMLVFPLTFFVIWSMAYILFGDLALPGESLFALAILEVTAILLGHASELINLPPMVGMVFAGLLLRNFPPVALIGKTLDLSITSPLRAMSVVVLLSRGAFGVNSSLIHKLRFVIPPLYVGCCIAEAIGASIAVYFIIGFPIQWAIATGCIFSAMTGAGVMPYLLNLERDGYGSSHDVMAIAKQASGLDAILAINLTELAFGFIFANGDLLGGITKGLGEVLMGGAFATLWGALAGLLLEDCHGATLKSFIVFCGGSMGLLGLTKIGYPRGGPLGCYFGAFLAYYIWQKKSTDTTNNKEVGAQFTILWYFFQPLLFGIIGSRVDFATVDWNIVTKSLLCLTISLTIRMITAYLMLFKAEGMTVREKLFIAVAWLPKGTVQAALGPVALDTALTFYSNPEFEDFGYKVLYISVTVIVTASIFGSLVLAIFGRILLKK